MKPAPPVQTEIVLIGAGHAHVEVMRAFGERPMPGASVTVVADALRSPYSGMLPGLIAGDHAAEAMHIDIVRLAEATGCRLIHAAATGIDRGQRRVLLGDGPPLSYDLVSINVGITPDLSGIAGAWDHAVPVKPIAGFLSRLVDAERAIGSLGRPVRIAVIGGGAAGVELAFAFQDRWLRRGREASVVLIAGNHLLPGLNGLSRLLARRALDAAGIALIVGDRAVAAEPGAVRLASGRIISADATFISTAARPPDWLGAVDLRKGENGGIAVRPTLQSLDDDRVFAVGDCATMIEDPRPRAGVFAVRQGPVLARNLAAAAEGEPLTPYRPQRDYLTLLRVGDGKAVAARGRWLAASGRWVRWWKSHIDRAFVDRFEVGSAPPDRT